jgi:hypothetical protein
VQEHKALFSEVPAGALASEAAFRDYVTSGVHRDVSFTRSVFELSSNALNDLETFITHKAQFDMHILFFTHFNQAFQLRQTHSK